MGWVGLQDVRFSVRFSAQTAQAGGAKVLIRNRTPCEYQQVRGFGCDWVRFFRKAIERKQNRSNDLISDCRQYGPI